MIRKEPEEILDILGPFLMRTRGKMMRRIRKQSLTCRLYGTEELETRR